MIKTFAVISLFVVTIDGNSTPYERWNLLMGAGRQALSDGDFASAENSFHSALRIEQELAPLRRSEAMASTCIDLGCLYANWGKVTSAKQYLRGALYWSEQMKGTLRAVVAARAGHELAKLAIATQKNASAIKMLETVLVACRAPAERPVMLEISVLATLASVHANNRDFESVRTIARQIDDLASGVPAEDKVRAKKMALNIANLVPPPQPETPAFELMHSRFPGVGSFRSSQSNIMENERLEIMENARLEMVRYLEQMGQSTGIFLY